MNIATEALSTSDTAFHGIIPTEPAYPLGKISLMVVFGQPGNFRKERLEFEVVDWESQYHAILGRPAYAKFMAIPHYVYLKLKMPGNNGTPLTVHDSFLRSDNCDKEFNRIAQKFGAKDQLELADKVNPSTPSVKAKTTPAVEVSPLVQTGKAQPPPEDPTKNAIVSKSLADA